jgi:DNA-binding NarL/FixJ family response regulator
MSGFRVMVVDDSPFSRTLLADALMQGGCEVVGEAESIESLIQVYDECKPDLVTMDIAMPGADGFECTKTLRLHDPAAKVVLVSSMKDEETEADARHAGAVGYVQKPVDGDVLIRVIQNVMSPDEMYLNLQTWSHEIFAEVLAQNITRMTKTTAKISEQKDLRKNISQGITVVIGIIGRYPGSIVFDLSLEAAEKMAEIMLRRAAKNQAEVVSVAAEFANVVGGVACSMLNRKEKSFGLRVAPPSVFQGATNEIISPMLQMQGMAAATDFGQLCLSFGFKKGTVLWM